ncbi:MAG: aldehyde dehydrogenase family protein [Planctomycetes bacterium]|nr:aldehyde dehydrogenase family protein [Planctomycetota bacterium]MCW8136389.1 aldehyde dehydrogenase family protein [Planctomycetota bacterium]
MTTHPLWLAGSPVATSHMFQHRGAYDRKDLGEVCLAGRGEAAAALSAAWHARPAMARMSSGAREAALLTLAEGVQRREEEFAQMMTAETGKPISLCRGEVSRSINTLRLSAEEAKRPGGEVIPLDTLPAGEGRYGVIRRFPKGIVVAITPFNFPLNLVAHKIGPAIAAGCPFILKPAPQAPLTALMLGELLKAARLPEGAFSILPCENDVAQAIATDDRVAVLSFTGSDSVGWKLRELTPRKTVLLELGGNAAVIVEPDADLENAAQRIVSGAFAHAGQVCIKVQRVFAHESIARQLLNRMAELTEALGIGDPTHEDIIVGPMISEQAAQRVEEWVNEARNTGANVVTGGERDGQFYRPTWLTDVPEDAKVSCREVFGPVAVFYGYQHFEAAVAAVNSSPYGLQAGVFSRSLPHVNFAFEQLEVGAIIVNDIPTYRVDHMPYGGVKASGAGREGPKYVIEEYTEPRLLAVKPL